MPIITFEDYLPLPRHDGIPWTKARIEESSVETGPWALVEEKIFGTVDPDPSTPSPRSFTTELATLDDGWYRITFVDADGSLLNTDPLHYPPIDEADSDYVPTVTEVADYIRTRTRNQYGQILGTFNNTTEPNAQQVTGLIRKAVSDVTTAVDYDIPEEMNEQVRDLIALGAALRVELSFFPEQVGTDRSPYDELKALYDKNLEALILAVSREKAELVEGEEAAATVMFAFPSAEPLWPKVF